MEISEFLKIFDYIKESFINENILIVRIKPDGIIEDTVKRDADTSFWSMNTFYAKRLMNQNIRELFNIPIKKSMADLAHSLTSTDHLFSGYHLFYGEGAFSSRNKFERYEVRFELYADHPYSTLFLKYYKALGFFGLIRIHGFGNKTYHFRYQPLLILDHKGFLTGYNNQFASHFLKEGEARTSLFKQHVTKFLKPNPLETLIGNSAEFSTFLKEKWKKTLEIDFSKANDKKIKEAMNIGEIQRVSNGIVWSSPEEKQMVLQIKKPVNTVNDDLRLEFTFTCMAGEFPSVIFNGTRDYTTFFPDYQGYLCGPHFNLPLFQIKKESSIVHTVPFDAPPLDGKHTITLLKRGLSIAVFIDNCFITGYRDPVPKQSNASYQYLYNRIKSKIILHSIKMFTLPSAKAIHLGFNEVSLRIKEENGFEFIPISDIMGPEENNMYYVLTLHNFSYHKRNIKQLEKTQKQIIHERDRFKALAFHDDLKDEFFIGQSPAIVSIKKYVQKMVDSDISMLIEGETGTGKEVLAKYIHKNSPQKKGPFIKVDCSTLPETLIESELFGVEKGAFTGATESRMGKLEAADNGTLFLDELANLDLKTQAKLLNFLQDFTLVRLGSTKQVKVNTRIIGATNRSLKALIDNKQFRADLYFRLSAFKFQVPPLRDHLEDITLLCKHFLGNYNLKLNRAIKGFTAEAHQKLLDYHWPGNIRELENTVHNAVLFCEHGIIDANHIKMQPGTDPAQGQESVPSEIPFGDSRALTEPLVRYLLEKNHNIARRAAKEAKVSRATFYRKMKRFGIK
jgi:two-component system response regulator AtoC